VIQRIKVILFFFALIGLSIVRDYALQILFEDDSSELNE